MSTHATPLVSAKPVRIIRIKDVMSRTGISRSHIYSLATSGGFPKSISLVEGGSSVGWIEGEIEEWITQRIMARS